MPYKIRQPGTHNFYTDAGLDFEFATQDEAQQFVDEGGLEDADEDVAGYEIVETDDEGYERDV